MVTRAEPARGELLSAASLLESTSSPSSSRTSFDRNSGLSRSGKGYPNPCAACIRRSASRSDGLYSRMRTEKDFNTEVTENTEKTRRINRRGLDHVLHANLLPSLRIWALLYDPLCFSVFSVVKLFLSLPQDNRPGNALGQPAEARPAGGAARSAAPCRRLKLRPGS